jgi:hypothetical protein
VFHLTDDRTIIATVCCRPRLLFFIIDGAFELWLFNVLVFEKRQKWRDDSHHLLKQTERLLA